MLFAGVDLGWEDKPTGVALLRLQDDYLRLIALDRVDGLAEVGWWIAEMVGSSAAMIAVDAPLIIANDRGSRAVDRAVSSNFGRYDACCHSANRGRSFAPLTTGFSEWLASRGFQHAATVAPRTPGRYQIEVQPHAAVVQLFALDRIVKYKKGPRDGRARELRRFRDLILTALPNRPRLLPPTLDEVPPRGVALKPLEDKLDALLCAYIGAHWWWWGTGRNDVFGDADTGYIVVPHRTGSAHPGAG